MITRALVLHEDRVLRLMNKIKMIQEEAHERHLGGVDCHTAEIPALT